LLDYVVLHTVLSIDQTNHHRKSCLFSYFNQEKLGLYPICVRVRAHACTCPSVTFDMWYSNHAV